MKTELLTVPIEKLKEFDKNPNKHPEAQLNALRQSITKYGQYYPIIVDEAFTILAGHGKYQALKSLDSKTVLINQITGLKEKDKKKLVLEDNKIQEMSHMDFNIMRELIEDIGEVEIIGFDAHYLNALVGDLLSDNMGVDHENLIDGKEYSKEDKQKSIDALNQLEGGMGIAKEVTCPECKHKFIA